MKTRQVSLTLPVALLEITKEHAKNFGFRSTQELITEALREKIMKKDYDESFTEKEIALIDNIIKTSILRGDLGTEEDLMKVLG